MSGPTSICVALAICLLLSACKPADPSTQTIQFWAMGREAEAMTTLLPEFERRHPQVKVQLLQVPWTAAHSKLLTAFASDGLPDVFQLGNTWVPEFAALDALAPLDARVGGDASVAKADYFQGIWDTNVVDGVLYGLPWYVDTRLLFYRRDLLAQAGFSEPPTTWAQWLDMQRAIKALPGPAHYSVLLPLNEYEPLMVLAIQQDDAMLRDDDRYGNFRSDSMQQMLAFYQQMFAEGLAPKMTNTEISNVWTEFGRGFFSFYISGPWNIAEFDKRMPADLKDAWMTATMPGPGGPGASVAGGSSLVMARNSTRADAAWQLIAYLSEPAVQIQFHALVGDMPPRRSSWDGSPLASNRYALAFREQLERARPAPRIPEWEQIATQLRLVGELLVHDRLTVDQAAEELDRRTDRILQKRRWILERKAERDRESAGLHASQPTTLSSMTSGSSSPRRRGSRCAFGDWIPAFAGMTSRARSVRGTQSTGRPAP